jgi:L,D-transpeptidase catalytic domain/Putative peptidoglycan binding domain
MSRRCAPLPALLAALAVVPTAAAQTPPAKSPAPAPAAGKMSISVAGGVPTKRMRWVVRGQRVVVRGTVRPFVPGQVAVVSIVRQGRVKARRLAPIKAARRGRGRFVVRFVARRRGLLRLVATHVATPQQAFLRARSKRVRVVRWTAGQGARGTKVVLLQRTLKRLGFATPVTGSFDSGTSRAVLAYRKANRLGRTGFASASVYDKVLRRRGQFRVRHPRAGRHVEFDWSRQVLALVKGGRPYRVYHASSGTAATPTVFGRYRFYRKQPGTNAKGMLHSNYFIGGYAIHGYPSVPAYPASHGCIRVPNPNAADIDRWIRRGMTIFVYR